MLKPEQIAAIIKAAGGTSKFAKMVGTSRQAVHHWRTRGIPYKVLYEHSEAIGKLRRKRT